MVLVRRFSGLILSLLRIYSGLENATLFKNNVYIWKNLSCVLLGMLNSFVP